MIHKFETKEEMIRHLNYIAAGVYGKDDLVTIGWSRYGIGINNFQTTPTSVMIDEIMSIEESMVDEDRRYKGEFYIPF